MGDVPLGLADQAQGQMFPTLLLGRENFSRLKKSGEKTRPVFQGKC